MTDIWHLLWLFSDSPYTYISVTTQEETIGQTIQIWIFIQIGIRQNKELSDYSTASQYHLHPTKGIKNIQRRSNCNKNAGFRSSVQSPPEICPFLSEALMIF
jgi:hypothetical protein